MILFLSGTCFLDGSIHNYVSDFLVEKVDGTRLLVEVKPKVFSDNRVNTTKTSSDVSWYDIIGFSLFVVSEADLHTTRHC